VAILFSTVIPTNRPSKNLAPKAIIRPFLNQIIKIPFQS